MLSPAEHGGGGLELFTPLFGHDGKTGLVWLLINFVVLYWILEKLLFSKLRASTAQKHDQIKSELDDATKAHAEATSMVAEYRDRLARLDSEVDEILSDARQRGEADRQRILEGAKQEAGRITASAKSAAEREADFRRRQIEGEVVDRAVTRAAELLEKRMTPADQERMVGDYVAQLDSMTFGGDAP